MRWSSLVAMAASAALILAGCEARDVAEDTGECTRCHGGESGNAAPPVTVANADAVGAHQQHLVGGALGRSVACTECHAVPADASAPGHLGPAPAELTWGSLAAKGGLSPQYAGGTCSSVYCHGATLAGGSRIAPSWNGGAAERACGSCHGLPPPTGDDVGGVAAHAFHVERAELSCSACHTFFAVGSATHINGVVDARARPGEPQSGWGCTRCHE